MSTQPEAQVKEKLPLRTWVILGAVSMGSFTLTSVFSMMTIAIPAVADDLNASVGAIQWMVLMSTGLMAGLGPLYGRLSDIWGRPRMFVLGLVIYSLGSVGSALAWDIGSLIGARVIAGLGGAMVMVNALAIITDTFPPGRRGLALGLLGTITSAALLLGPTLGGVMVTNLGWRSIFWFNVALGFGAAVLALVTIPNKRSDRKAEPIDWLGAFLVLAGLGLILLGFSKGLTWGWGSPATLGSILGGMVIGVVFVTRQLHAAHPLVDITLFRIGLFAGGQVTMLAVNGVMSGMAFMLALYWQGPQGLSAQGAGLLMLALPVPMVVVSAVSGRMSDVISPRWLTLSGMAVMIVGALLVSAASASTAVWDVVWRITILGVGLGIYTAPTENLLMSSVPVERRGVAAGLVGLFRFSASSIGVAIAGAIYVTVLVSQLGNDASLRGTPADFTALSNDPTALAALKDAAVDGVRVVFLSITVLLSVGGAIAWFLFTRVKDHKEAVEAS
jgi:EmrB/QacA subfamily drug resistance transporter